MSSVSRESEEPSSGIVLDMGKVEIVSVSAYDEGEVLKVTACNFELNALVALAFQPGVWEVQRLRITTHQSP